MPKILKISVIALVSLGFILILSFFGGRYAFNAYFDKWAKKLVELERQGLLSTEFGAGWQDVLAEQAMQKQADKITSVVPRVKQDSVLKVNGIAIDDYPSLSIIARLNEVSRYSNTIAITDCKDRPLATIRTNHTRAPIREFPPVLLGALIAAEDRNFHANKLGVEYDSFFRAVLRSVVGSIMHFRLEKAKGTSTITQQVAKLFISKLDVSGRRQVSRSLDRKLREIRLAAALRRLYTDDQILEVYVNHCITSDYNLVGIKDIALGLFAKNLSQLSDAQCIYLARMVKWGRNVPRKIQQQCHTDMPRIAAALKWGPAKQRAVLAQIDALTFEKPRRVATDFGPLVDLANEYWLLALKRNGASAEALADMDLINANSLIRKKGTCTIKLTIDLALQRELERLVNSRGYGQDTTIITDVRIGSSGNDGRALKLPPDTQRSISVIEKPTEFSEEGSSYKVKLTEGDTLIANIHYKKTGPSKFHRSCYYYARRATTVSGQYFAYAALDSKTGKLLAYYSKDRLGSRLTCLLKNRIPNGSSTAKPIFNALNFDLGNFKLYSTWSDSSEVTEDVPWKRLFKVQNGKNTGVIFANSAVRNVGYQVHNHGGVFEGCRYIFDLLASSNNILGVETVYRLNTQLFNLMGGVRPEALGLTQYFYRIGDFGRIKNELHLSAVTGVRVYKELARIAGVDIDSITSGGRRIPVSDSMYSVALGTLELNLYEQLHLYNMLYNNDLIERPADHPSLVVESILLNGDSVAITDTLRHFHPFADLNNLRPTWLGMHKRLVSNPGDGLGIFDITDSAAAAAIPSGGKFDPLVLTVTQPPANYAKSGTTDDVIRPFNVGSESPRRTDYGLWNTVLRLDFSRLTNGGPVPEVRDVTIACVGECNERFTGARDGKTLHKFVSMGLLKKAGIPCPNGFFARYDAYLKSVAPDSFKTCGNAAGTISENQE
ncbi:MAG: transglycosylase domain-containing protein [Chitinivibrionales bacterium]|nr:transglycosylase domain-containing protein [Chitinivibrionales bacterium]